MSAWLYLAVAIVLEVAGTINLKLSNGFSRVAPSAAVVVLYVLSFVMLSAALKRHMSVGVAYAIWSAVGTALIAGIGIVWFGEPLSRMKVLSLLLIIVGVVGLNASGAH